MSDTGAAEVCAARSGYLIVNKRVHTPIEWLEGTGKPFESGAYLPIEEIRAQPNDISLWKANLVAGWDFTVFALNPPN